MSDPQDLVGLPTLTNFLAAAPVAVTPAQTAILPNLITAASQLICRECNRFFTLTAYDEVLNPFKGQPDKGQPDFLTLSYLPVRSVTRCSANWTTALSVWNANAQAQEATVQYTFAGDVEIATTITGLTLNLSLNGVDTSSTITWGSAPYTVANLATAINALGNGWTAAAATSMGGWAASKLWGDLDPKNALTPPGTDLGLFATTVTSRADYASGLVYLPLGNAQQGGPGNWWNWPASADIALGQSTYDGSYRVAYTAGWSMIPGPIQIGCCELVKYTLDRMRTDGGLKSEKAREYQYEIRAAWHAIPEWVREAVYKYLVVP